MRLYALSFLVIIVLVHIIILFPFRKILLTNEQLHDAYENEIDGMREKIHNQVLIGWSTYVCEFAAAACNR